MKKLFSVGFAIAFFVLAGCAHTQKEALLDADATARAGWTVGDKVVENEGSCFFVDSWQPCTRYRQFLGATKDGRYLVQDFYEQGHTKLTDSYFVLRQEDVLNPDFDSLQVQIDGPFARWYPNGDKWYSGSFENGKMTGIWTLWYSNGQKAAEGTIDGGRENGTWSYWHENGQQSSKGDYANGSKNGVWKQWYSNGLQKSEANMVDGKLDGAWTEWYESGVKQAQGQYDMDKPVGVWQEWDMAGQLLKEENRG